ncbi:hypothetical protein HPB48_022090 [Haemaphysalis longicornis]|uniref:Uncharacterized protein n=1 Tax=Haemaphysalis longicornis TaxID=44386 RepID=A0A9J6GM35_HAELO|nr:hypothetical protein HPB48_022090 [Haemaphysalis longicornis]
MAIYHRLISPRKEHQPLEHPTWAFVAAAVAVVLVVCLLVIVAVLHRTGDHHAAPCTSPGCTEYAKVLSDTLDTTADPCHSFDSYVCAGWHAAHRFSVRIRVISRALQGMIESVRKDTDLPPGNQSFHQKVSLFYLSCDDVRREGHNQVSLIREQLQSAGIVWPRLSGEPNVVRTLIYLSVELDWSVVLKVSPLGHSIRIDPAVSFWWALEENERRSETMRRRQSFDLLKAHFSIRSDEASIGFKETDAVEQAFLPALAFAYDAEDNTLEQLPSGSLRESQWIRALADFNLPVVPEFTTTNLGFVEAFLDLYERYGEAETHLFISWMAVRYAGMFANSELISNHYDSGNPNIIRYRHGRWCYTLAYEYIGDLLFAPYNAHVYKATVRRDVERLVRSVRSELAGRLSTKAPYAADSSLTIKWSSMDTVLSALSIGSPGSENSTALAHRLPNMTKSLVANWRAMWKALGSRYERIFFRTFGRGQEFSFAAYSASRGDFVLAPHVLTFPIYDIGLVDAVKYGAFGGMVATESSNLAFAHYYKNTNVTNVTLSAVEDALKCANRSSSQLELSDIVTSIAALDIATTAFRDHGSQLAIKDANYLTPMQLLFVSWCYLRCPGRSEALSDGCDGIVRHIPEFSRAFKCNIGTPLNPPDKCTLF